MNYMHAIATINFEELLRPKQVGEVVPSHVLEHVRQPAPDFSAMQRLISGGNHRTTQAVPTPSSREPKA